MKTTLSPLSRRKFLAFSSVASAVIASERFTAPSQAADAPTAPAPVSPKRAYPIGLELYSVRDELARDLPNTLRTVATLGYEVVEFYAPYFGWTIPYAKEVRSRLEDLGLRCRSTHNGFDSFKSGETMAKAIELNQILGTRYLVLASALGGNAGLDDWKRLCQRLAAASDELQPHGLSAGFHNHESEWRKVDGDQRVMDLIAANTPAEFILQLDVGTCVEAGADPVAWITANPGRIRSIHLKDWAPGTRAQEKGYRVLFGEGVAPWKDLLAAAESVGGVEYYLLEQEGSRFSEFETARRCLDAWKRLRATS